MIQWVFEVVDITFMSQEGGRQLLSKPTILSPANNCCWEEWQNLFINDMVAVNDVVAVLVIVLPLWYESLSWWYLPIAIGAKRGHTVNMISRYFGISLSKNNYLTMDACILHKFRYL